MTKTLRIIVSAMAILLFSPAMQLEARVVSGLNPTVSEQADPSKGRPDVKVWVNTSSSVYHCPGTRYYGNTKKGTYMTQAEAQKTGNRPAYGKVCQ